MHTIAALCIGISAGMFFDNDNLPWFLDNTFLLVGMIIIIVLYASRLGREYQELSKSLK